LKEAKKGVLGNDIKEIKYFFSKKNKITIKELIKVVYYNLTDIIIIT